ncbi:MAG TPA: hypothetical protein VKQ32_23555 [Polyangia bacterium]|nr:hypothetical protein [Polyangia bacterium]
MPPSGALARARRMLLGLMPLPLGNAFADWESLAGICDTGWLLGARRPTAATERVAQRRLRALAARPIAFPAFAALRPGHGPVHLRGTCNPLPGRDSARELWRLDVSEQADVGRVLVEEASDFLLSVDGGEVYVLSKGGHLVSGAPVRPGDVVSVFGFADAIPDAIGLGASPSGRGGLMHAIRSGSELPLLVAHVVR